LEPRNTRIDTEERRGLKDWNHEKLERREREGPERMKLIMLFE
jgi:hypothetical protein